MKIYHGMLNNNIDNNKQAEVILLQVACLGDAEAHLVLEEGDPFSLQTKPHGHGDVHALLHSSGLVKKWHAKGVRWVCFFQDTNGLVFRGLPAAMGERSHFIAFDVQSLCTPADVLAVRRVTITSWETPHAQIA